MIEKPLTIPELCEKYKNYSKVTIKKWINERHENGLCEATTKPSKQIFIYESKFLEWLESKRETKHNPS